MPKTGVHTFVPLFFLITSSLHFLLLLDIQFFSDHSINVLTISTELSCSFHTGETILVSSAYLNRISLPFKHISRSLRKMVNKWGPLTHHHHHHSSSMGTPGALTVYPENPEILVGKWIGTYHSNWNISEIIGYRLNQCIFSFPFELSNWY